MRQIRELTQPLAEQVAVQADATLANAEKQYARSKELADKNFVGKSQLDDATRALEVARSQVLAARAQVASTRPAGADTALAEAALQQARASARVAEAKLAETAIRAPVDGTLISRAIDRGDVAQPGKTLMVLSPTGATQLVVQIDEKNLRLLRVGQPALAAADAYPADRFDATLAYINPGIDAQRGSVEVKLNVEKPPAYLRQDMTVSVDIEVARHGNALVLPLDAVRDTAGAAPWVLAANNGRAERRAIKIGVRGSAKVEVLEGLAEHDRVFRATGVALKDGERVRAITP
jgi:HlyD family secretion protein